MLGLRFRKMIPAPQWNPAVKTGSTDCIEQGGLIMANEPQWNPAVKTGSTSPDWSRAPRRGYSLNGTRP